MVLKSGCTKESFELQISDDSATKIDARLHQQQPQEMHYITGMIAKVKPSHSVR